MNSVIHVGRRSVLAGFALMMVLALAAGCKSEEAIPLDKRPAGTDLSPQDRADKKGDTK